MSSQPPPQRRADTFAAMRSRNFRLFFFGRLVWALGEQMLNIAIGWELYERTNSAFALGIVGLVQILPVISFALISGQVADRYDRKRIVLMVQVVLGLCGLALAVLSYNTGDVFWFYFVLLITGFGAAFQGPAAQALLPAMVEPPLYHSAATWSSSSWQIAAMLGPTLGGALIAIFKAAWPIYLLNAVGCLFYIMVLLVIRERKLPLSKEPVTRETLMAGIKFLLSTRIVLGAITLDMFAVLFGGAVALLPIYARDILMVGPEGLGWLRAMPSIGALLVALIIASRPPFERAGRTLLIAVAGFGIATIVFGLSTNFFLSCAALFALGGLDNVSVVVRHTLMLTRIPDEMRGRVSALNSMFIGISNELGTFESGLTAAIMGTVGAVVFGGVGTLVVVAMVAWKIPELRRLQRLI